MQIANRTTHPVIGAIGGLMAYSGDLATGIELISQDGRPYKANLCGAEDSALITRLDLLQEAVEHVIKTKETSQLPAHGQSDQHIEVSACKHSDNISIIGVGRYWDGLVLWGEGPAAELSPADTKTLLQWLSAR